MASKGGKRLSANTNGGGILAKVSDSAAVQKGKKAACDSAYVAKRLMKSTGKAAWIVATTFLVLGLPLIIVMDREQQLNDLDLQQQSLLGTPTPLMAPTK